jgi:hypothetical protein
MTPIQIKQYLIDRKIATLQDIAIHFRKETDTITPMLDIWVRKGKVKKNAGDPGCGIGCCKCDPATLETYEWLN